MWGSCFAVRQALQAIRANECSPLRRHPGASYRWIAFVISGAFTASAARSGVPDGLTSRNAYWPFSGELVYDRARGSALSRPHRGRDRVQRLKTYASRAAILASCARPGARRLCGAAPGSSAPPCGSCGGSREDPRNMLEPSTSTLFWRTRAVTTSPTIADASSLVSGERRRENIAGELIAPSQAESAKVLFRGEDGPILGRRPRQIGLARSFRS